MQQYALCHDSMNMNEMEYLEDFLYENKKAMSASMIDGFLAAIAIGPDMILPSEWFPRIFGKEGPDFESEEQAKSIFGMIMTWYNRILNQLAENPEEYKPLIPLDENEQPTFQEWAVGFYLGINLRPNTWDALFKSEQYQIYMTPIVANLPDTVEQEMYDMVYETLCEDPMRLADSVIKIDHFWKQARQYYHGRTKIGRNDPCFCGSGKKFKKCCGTH